ncbi:MAG: cell division protein SepF [Candidatus Aenigmarchaeota archaeon]|nr:cell division protein SepF [Candidatus Aenigmarchaeota archaeon]MDI6722984.1 cell division protein SepF [Candidatus Aenigmarchaeota archaeon]
MVVKGIFGKRSGDDEEYVELEHQKEERMESKIPLEIERIEIFDDSERIQDKLRTGRILIVKVKSLREKDVSELKRAINRIKRTCMAVNGDLAAIGDDWLIVTPSTAKVHKQPVG